jgi:sulfite oxidase
MTGWGKRADTIVHGDDPFNAEPARLALAENPLTPIEAFYARNHGPIPDIDPGEWRLTVDGRVDHPLTLSLDDLQQRFPHRELLATLQCAGNRRLGLIDVNDIPGETPWGPGATSTARWTGAALADVLTAADAAADATDVAFTGLDISPQAEPEQPFGASIPMGKATAGEVLLAW